VIIFLWGYSRIPDNYYQYRDDGVITMSSARNLIDFGFIGVSPSGPIVEVSSSPMQFFTYALAYLMTGVDYSSYSYWQTILATFIIGFFFISFFKERPIVSIIVTMLGALCLTFCYPFFEWHASGMENAITHVLFLTTIYILFEMFKRGKTNYWLSMAVFFATISRIDSVYHISALLLLFSAYWLIKKKNLQAFYFSCAVAGLWLLFQMWRYYYFGDVLPNTAYAQGITVGDRISMFLSGGHSYFTESYRLAREIFTKHAGWFLLPLVPMLYFVKKSEAYKFFILMLFSLILTSCFNPFIFGPTRLDHVRTTTQMALAIVLLASIVLYLTKSKKAATAICITLITTTLFFYHHLEFSPYALGWPTRTFNRTRQTLAKIADDNNISRATISNPDLGVMTWYKNFNVIDLGMLGSPIMARIKNGPMMTAYYLYYGLPDLIEVHGFWAKEYYKSIFSKIRFTSLYSQVGVNVSLAKLKSGKAPHVYWIRNDVRKDSNSRERKFLDALQNELSIKRITQEIESSKQTHRDCSYIARTVYKFIPELRRSGKFDKVYSLFSSATDKALLRGWKDAQAHEVIIGAIKRHFEPPEFLRFKSISEKAKLMGAVPLPESGNLLLNQFSGDFQEFPGGKIRLCSNGSVDSKPFIFLAGQYRVRVLARGNRVRGETAQFKLTIGRKIVISAATDENAHWIQGELKIENPDVFPVTVTFENDCFEKIRPDTPLFSGSVIQLKEGNWNGTLTRIGETDNYAAKWRNKVDGEQVSDTVTVRKFTPGSIVLYRKGLKGCYRGQLSPDGTFATGTADWYKSNGKWKATFPKMKFTGKLDRNLDILRIEIVSIPSRSEH